MKKIRGWMLAGLLLCAVLVAVCACAGAEEEHKHETITFTMWTDSLAEQQNGAGKDAHNSLPSVAGNYFLMSDVSIYTTWVVPAGVTNLCLNKKEITGPAVCVIMILPGRTLNLYDEGSEGKVSISGSTGTGNSVYNYGTFTMYGGSIEGDQMVDNAGVLNYGIFTMYGGDITKHSVTSANGGGVCNYGTFTMHGGNISGNKANNGGGVYNDGTFTMNGGNIVNNSVKQQGHGGGVYVKSGTFSMTDGTINNNSTFEKGGGVYVDSGTFDMSGGVISNNVAGIVATGFFGGGGIYVSANGTLKMKGSLAITGNKCYTAANNDVCLANGRKITVTGQLNVNANAKIGIIAEGDKTFTSGYKAAGNTADPSDIFSSDDNQYRVEYDDLDSNEARLIKNGTHEHNRVVFETWNDSKKLPEQPGDYYLDTDVVLNSNWQLYWSKSTVHLCLNGHSIKMEGKGPVISFTQDETMELYDCKQAGCITHADGCTGPGVEINGGINSKFIMHGGIICNNHNDHGGGVAITDCGGTFEMKGGTISGNTAVDEGGGVFVKVARDGKVIMSGGTISGNSAMNGGGILTRDTFTMTGGVISGNSVTGSMGGGVSNYGVMNLAGNPVISGNTDYRSKPNNIRDWGGSIKISGKLEDTASIGISIRGVFTRTEDANLAYNEADHFFSDDSSCMIGKNKAGQLVCDVPCEITYNANNATGGKVPTDSKNPYAKGSAVTVLGNTGNLERKGYTYDEWDTQADGNGTRYAADDIFDNGGTTTLYARWIPIPAKAPAISAEPQNLALTYGYGAGSISAAGVADAGTDYTLSYQWYSCDADGNNEAEIPGAAASSYEIPAGKTAGTTEYYLCKVTGTRIDNGLSAVTASAAVKVTVGKKAVTVKAKNKTITYGDAPANDGVTYAGFVNNETETVLGGTLAYDYSYAQFGNVGSYTITPKGLTADNYEITYADGALTINPLVVSVTAKNQTIKEGESIATGTEMASLSGALDAHVLSTVTLTGDPEKESITPSAAVISDAAGKSVTDNYAICYVPSNLTTRKAISRTVTFKVVNGAWNDGKTEEKTVTLNGYEGDVLKLAADNIPGTGDKPAENYKAGSWDKVPDPEKEVTADTVYTYTYIEKDKISAIVTFKVKYGYWDDGSTEDQVVTLTGREGDVLKLAAEDIPAVGSKPADTYKAGAWDVIPAADTVIEADTAYTYTYAEKDKISATVTFRVVNGSWGDGTREEKTVVLTGYEGDELRLKDTDIPNVTKPDEGYEFGTGTWTPKEPPIVMDGMTFGDPITEDTTYTYTYAEKNKISKTVTFKVVNGAWDDGTTEDRTVTLKGYEGDILKLAAADIPAVGSKPADTYKAGAWDAVPEPETAISEDTVYTYSFVRKAPSGRLEPKVSSAGKTALKVSWNRVENVDGYDIFFSECGDTNDLNSHLYKTVSAKKTSLTIKNLKKGNSYKLRVKPFVLKKGKKKYYGEAVTIHCIAGGTDGTYSNVTAMKPKHKQLTVTVGQEKKAEAKLTLEVPGMQPLAHAGGAIAYSSSDPKVATVSADGVVKGVKAGTCRIEMRANSGVTATVKVTVTKGPKKIFFPKKEYTLKLKKKTLDLKAKLKFEPSDATLVLTWKSSAPKTASVDKNGVVTAHKKGEATITVIAANGKKTRVKIVVK